MNRGDERSFAHKVLIASAVVALVFGLLYFVQTVAQVLLVFFAGVLFGMLLDGGTRLLGRFLPLPRGARLALLWLLLLVLLVGGGWWLGPKIGEQLAQLGEQLPRALDRLRDQVMQFEWAQRLLQRLPQPGEAWGGGLVQRLTSFFASAFGFLANAVIILFVGAYLAVNPRLYTRVVVRLVPIHRRGRAEQVFAALGHVLRRWLVGRLASMLVVGGLIGAALWLVGMPLAFSLGLIAGVLSFIPYLGPILSAVPAVIIALSQGPQMALYVLAIYGGVQAVESYLVTPLIEKRAVSIPPAYQITVQVIAGLLGGFFGVLLATPLAVTAAVLAQLLYVEDVLGDHPDSLLGEGD